MVIDCIKLDARDEIRRICFCNISKHQFHKQSVGRRLGVASDEDVGHRKDKRGHFAPTRYGGQPSHARLARQP